MSQTLAFARTRKIIKERLAEIKALVDAALDTDQRTATEVAASINNDFGTFLSPRQITSIWLAGSPFERV